MKNLQDRLKLLKNKIDKGNVSIMIMGLGSVGLYLLDYIISMNDPSIKVIAAGRNEEKMQPDVNIVRISSLIRNQNKSNVIIDSPCDLNNINDICERVKRHSPDFIVNTSRVYPGLKYGTISWHNFRSYGIWSPLAVNLIRNIMQAAEKANTDAVIINASYSDAVIPWLKSADMPYPDFGSGNLNHLIPRIKYAASFILNIPDFWNIDVRIATAHFHDVVISKEGQTEGQDPLLALFYKGEKLSIKDNEKELYSLCKIPMPADQKRNMMNASSNFEIIFTIINALKNNTPLIFHSPGALGLIGGYPVLIDGKIPDAKIDESVFSLQDMIAVNKKSLFLDGIESIEKGILTYSDILLEKVKDIFKVSLPKQVRFNDIDKTADFIIENIIKKSK